MVRATRYVTPLREGGSLPGLVEADDDGTYVVKFRGAGQGTASLVAEAVVGELARGAGIRVPEPPQHRRATRSGALRAHQRPADDLRRLLERLVR